MTDRDAARALLDRLQDGPVSKDAVTASALQTLQAAGVKIEQDGTDLRLRSLPAFDWPSIEAGLKAPCRVEVHERLQSTNTRARTLAEAGHRDVAVLAIEQTAGRGRRDRGWESPPGGVWCSVLLAAPMDPGQSAVATFAGAVAIVDAARDLNVPATIKWPNDVQVPGEDGARKLAGILTERGGPEEAPWLVIGLGINADLDADQVPDGATSLAIERDEAVDRAAVTRAVLDRLYDLIDAPERTLAAWRDRADTLGRRVRVTTESETLIGRAESITETGVLVLSTATGRRTVSAGDCEHLRPA